MHINDAFLAVTFLTGKLPVRYPLFLPSYFVHFSQNMISQVTFFLFSGVLKVMEATIEVVLTFSSNYPIPGTNPQEYYVWQGTDITLRCSYSNDEISAFNPSMIIARDSADFRLQVNLITYNVNHDDPTASTLSCASNWAHACEAADRGANDDRFEGFVSITNTDPGYDESTETGEFECRVNFFTDGSNVSHVDVTGKRQFCCT